MPADAVMTAAVIVALIVALATERLAADVAVTAALCVLVVAGVLPVGDAFAGFASPAVLTVGALFVVAAGIQRAAWLDRSARWLFGDPKGQRGSLVRALPPVAAISALMNNTPLIAVMIPAASRWSRRYGGSISRVLMPLSFAAILGGTCTLIGTSTNLLISGMLMQRGHPELGFFEPTAIGLAMTVAGVLFLVLFAPVLLPERPGVVADLAEQQKEFIAEVRVTDEYPHLGRTVEEAGLRHLAGLYLFQIQRGDQSVTAVEPGERIHEGDRLFFTGLPDTLVELQQTPGLRSVQALEFDVGQVGREGARLFEVVVSNRSPLLGLTVRDAGFRQRYDAAILAIHRHGERIAQKIGDVVLHAGDTLLLVGDESFLPTWQSSPHFYVVTPGNEPEVERGIRPLIALAIAAVMVVAIASGLVSPLVGAATAGVLMVLCGCVPIGDARRAIDLKVMIVLASSLGLGLAVERGGLAGLIADAVTSGTSGSPWVLLAVVFALTAGMAAFIGNQASAALSLPLSLALANGAGADPRPFAMCVVFAASTSFSTPIGYQTNVMVWGPGNYRFADFVRLGVPLTVVVGVVALTGLSLFYL